MYIVCQPKNGQESVCQECISVLQETKLKVIVLCQLITTFAIVRKVHMRMSGSPVVPYWVLTSLSNILSN